MVAELCMFGCWSATMSRLHARLVFRFNVSSIDQLEKSSARGAGVRAAVSATRFLGF